MSPSNAQPTAARQGPTMKPTRINKRSSRNGPRSRSSLRPENQRPSTWSANGTDETAPDVPPPMTPLPPAGHRPPRPRAIKLHEHTWTVNGVTLTLHPLPPDDDAHPYRSIGEVMRLQHRDICVSQRAAILIVYASAWDPSQSQPADVKIHRVENCIREANLSAGYYMQSKLCGNNVPQLNRDVPEPEWEEPLDYNPKARFLYDYRTIRLADGKEYRAWVTMHPIRICEGCEGAPDRD
jgi:hypothetical protein